MFVRTLPFEIERLFGTALLPEGALVRERRACGARSPFGGALERGHDQQEGRGGDTQQE
jgi:hypothetical protein